MTEKPKPKQTERFTMLEPSGPINPSPEELSARVVDLAFKERFTMLEPSGPINPSPEELSARVVDLAFKERFTMLEPMGPNSPSSEELAEPAMNPLINGAPIESEPPVAVPPAVRSLLAQLVTVIAALDANGRAAALDYISNEFTKRLAG